MFFKKKSQNAVEFLMILIFIFTIILGLMYIVSIYMIEVKEQEMNNAAENFAENIRKELSIINRVEGGYYRELEIPSRHYIISFYPINNPRPIYLQLNDTAGNKTYHFDLISGNFNISLEPRFDGFNYTVLIFEKEKNDYYDGLVIS